MPPHPDAIVAAQKTGHARFLELCDPEHPAYNPGYLPVVAEVARGKAPEPPGLLTKAVNLASAVVTHVAAGMPQAPAELKASRLAVCSTCDQRLPGGTCAGCGCHLETKAGWRDQQCPLSKWPKPEQVG